MRDFNPLTHSAEDNGVVSDDVSRPNGLDADFAFHSFADHSLSCKDSDLFQSRFIALASTSAIFNAVPLGASFLSR